MRTFALACLLALPLAVAAQQMYRWVDEGGRVHFTDTPPPEGAKKSEKIEVKPTPPSGPVAAPSDYRKKELETRGDRLQKDQEAKKAAYDEARAAELKKARCRDAQSQLQVLRMQRPVFQTNEKGERVFLDDKDRQAELDKWQERAKTYCD